MNKKKSAIVLASFMSACVSAVALAGCNLPHKHKYEDFVTQATCQTQGYTTHTCSVCGESFKDSYTDVVSHRYVESIDIEPTCLSEGLKHTECEWCHTVGESNISIAIVPHEYEEIIDSEATCTQYGTGHKQCKWCDTVGDTYTIDKTEHTYTDVVVEATCQHGGHTEHTCSVCGNFYVDGETEKKDHDYTVTVVAPTCTGNGYTVDTCSMCGDTVYHDVLEALGHNYVKTEEIPATTTSKGKITYSCTRCPATYIEETPALSGEGHTHSWDNGTVTVQPTCTNVGTRLFVCDCGTSYTESIPAKGHSYKDTVVAPTCTEQGYTSHHCPSCGNDYVDTYVSKLGHDYKLTTKNATCTENGLKTYTCTRDGSHVYTEVIYATGHEYQNGTCTKCGQAEPHTHIYTSAVTTPATCKDNGVRTYTCSGCGDSYTESIPKTNNHTYTHTVVVPTCTENGYTRHTCSVCGNTYTDSTVSAVGHNYTETQRVDATCKDTGSVTRTCRGCGDVQSETLPKTNLHNYTNNVVPATCQAQGYTEHTCSVCGNNYKDTYTEKLAHSYAVTEDTESTCTATGHTTYTCSACGDHYTDNKPLKEHVYENGVCTSCGKEDVHEHEQTTFIRYRQTYKICTRDEISIYRCSCGVEFDVVTRVAQGHDFYEWEVWVEPSCQDGEERRDCKNCSLQETRVIPATGEHDWRTIEEYEATCTTPQYIVLKCRLCQETKERIINPALGHNYVGDCLRKDCTRCDAFITGHHTFELRQEMIIYPEKEFAVYGYWGVCTVNCGTTAWFYGMDTSEMTEEKIIYAVENGYRYYYKGTPCKTIEDFYNLYLQYGP